MPEIPWEKLDTQSDAVIQAQQKIHVYLWEGITENDTCQAVELPVESDKTVFAVGDFGSGNIPIEGSIMPSLRDVAIQYGALDDPQGNPLEISSVKPETVLQNVLSIRPGTPTGTAADIDLYMLVK